MVLVDLVGVCNEDQNDFPWSTVWTVFYKLVRRRIIKNLHELNCSFSKRQRSRLTLALISKPRQVTDEHPVFISQSPLLAECHVTVKNLVWSAASNHLLTGNGHIRWDLATINTGMVHGLQLTHDVVVQVGLLEGFT